MPNDTLPLTAHVQEPCTSRCIALLRRRGHDSGHLYTLGGLRLRGWARSILVVVFKKKYRLTGGTRLCHTSPRARKRRPTPHTHVWTTRGARVTALVARKCNGRLGFRYSAEGITTLLPPSARSVVTVTNTGAVKEGAPRRLGSRQHLALGRRHRPCGRRLPHTRRAQRLPAARRRGAGGRRRRRRGAARCVRRRLSLVWGSLPPFEGRNVPPSEALHHGDRRGLGGRASARFAWGCAGARFATPPPALPPSCPRATSRAQLA